MPAQATTQTFHLHSAKVASVVFGQLLWGGVFSEAARRVIIFSNTLFSYLRILTWNHCWENGNVLRSICSIGMQSFVAIYWLLMTLAMLKVWKAPTYLQTQIFPISFLTENGKSKWIQLKSYCRYPYDYFFVHQVSLFSRDVLNAHENGHQIRKMVRDIAKWYSTHFIKWQDWSNDFHKSMVYACSRMRR